MYLADIAWIRCGYSSDLTPGLGTSICHMLFSSKKTEKKKEAAGPRDYLGTSHSVETTVYFISVRSNKIGGPWG